MTKVSIFAKKHTQFLNSKKNLKKQQRSLLIKRYLSNNFLVFGSITIFLLSLLALFGPLLSPYGPYEMYNKLAPPGHDHLLGTDNYGRDLLTRIIYGARTSLFVGLLVAATTSILGMVIGLYASYYRVLDHIFMRICDGLMSIPGILLAIALMAALKPNVINVVIALSVVYTPHVARIVRSSALSVREQTYIEAMKSQGASTTRIIWLHIMPNTISPLIVQ